MFDKWNNVRRWYVVTSCLHTVYFSIFMCDKHLSIITSCTSLKFMAALLYFIDDSESFRLPQFVHNSAANSLTLYVLFFSERT